MRSSFFSLLTILFLFSCSSDPQEEEVYSSEKLSILKISDHSFIHVSQLKIPNYGNFPCNGLVYIKGNEAIVFDTPVNDSASAELISWLEKEQEKRIKAVVVTHFHIDCLGGLKTFHQENIPSYASDKTIALAKNDLQAIPNNGFERRLELTVGGEKTITKFYGKGHTTDNTVAFIPSERVLFGGCLIKAVGAKKGNLNDANLKEWSKTVRKIKAVMPNNVIVVPGHGKHGDIELLDYTIHLFQEDRNTPAS